jgi:RNA-directed DNA polymerase
VTRRTNSWRAGCGESRTSGSASGPGKRTGPKGQHRAPARLNVVMVAGTRDDAEALRDEVSSVLAPIGLRLSEQKTRVCHIDEGFDFLGFRIQRQTRRSDGKPIVYTYPSKKALASIKAKVKTMTRGATNQSLAVLCYRLAPVLRGWANYFRHGVSKSTFDYVREFTWRRVICWLRHKHPHANWKWLRRRYLPGWWPTDGDVVLFDIGKVTVSRYRYRGHQIATPWSWALEDNVA